MKALGIIMIVIASLCLLASAIFGIKMHYQYNKDYKYLWTMADRSSTIEQKSEYITKFVNKLESSNLQGEYNAIFLKTPENSFDYNFEAVKSLQKRLYEIKDMDPTSFQYQTAIQQITQQEQGEADEMMITFKGIIFKSWAPLLWDWICAVQVVACVAFIVLGAWIIDHYNY